MRKSLILLLCVELLVAIALGQLGHVDRRPTRRAYAEWREDPNPQTRAAFEREKRAGELERWIFSGIVFVALSGTTLFIHWLRKRNTAGTSTRI